MNKTLILFLFVAIVACKPDPVAQLVADYEQTLDDTKLELDFKANSVVHISDILASDSLAMYQEIYDSTIIASIAKWKSTIKESEDKIMEYEEKAKTANQAVKPLYGEAIDKAKVFVLKWKDELKELEETPDSHFNEEWLERKRNYKKLGEIVISKLYEVNYSILNPMLNVRQEITNKYYITPDLSAIQYKVRD